MNKREMLELAAKAAGVKGSFIQRFPEDGHATYSCGIGYSSQIAPLWNPRADDGDALRLAAALRLQIKPGKHIGDGCTAETQRDGIAGATAFYSDPARQMRMAVTIAAAEIGKAMS